MNYIPMNIIADASGTLITINESTEHQEGLTCPCCGSKLIVRAKNSVHMQPHFKHENGAACFTSTPNEPKSRRRPTTAGLLDSEIIEEYKKRVVTVSETVKIINRLKNEGLYAGYWNDLYRSCNKLGYYDQLMLYGAISRKSCIDKEVSRRISKVINVLTLNEVRRELNSTFGFFTINVLSLAPHSFICEKDGRYVKIESFGNEVTPRGIFLSPKDMEKFVDRTFIEKQLTACGITI